MISAREHLLLPAFYKSNDWGLDMTWLSQSTQNTNHWNQRMTRRTDVDLLKRSKTNHCNQQITRWTDMDLLKVCLYPII